jgi:hypothetical protein
MVDFMPRDERGPPGPVELQPANAAASDTRKTPRMILPDTLRHPSRFDPAISPGRKIYWQMDLFMTLGFGLYQRQNKKSIGNGEHSTVFRLFRRKQSEGEKSGNASFSVIGRSIAGRP